MRIIIIGGGIAGLSLAAVLHHRGLRADVYEAAPRLEPVGKGIWVPANALQVFDRLGLKEAIAARGVMLDRAEIHDRDAGVLQRIDLAGLRHDLGRTNVALRRADLQAVLAGAVPSDAVHLGKRCVGLVAREGGVVASFDDGTEEEGDVLVGADGIRSAVRPSVCGDVALRYAGQACYLGIADFRPPPGLAGTAWEVWGGASRFGFSPVADDRVYWFAPYTAPEGSPEPSNAAAFLQDRYGNFPGPIPELLRQTPAGDLLHVALYDFAPIDRWDRGRVVLIGDAAHATTPNLGQGGAQAVEDAYVLAEALSREPTPEAAFAAYQRIRRAKAVRVVTMARRLGRLAHVEAPWGRRLRNVVLRAVPERVNRRQVDALYALNY